MSNNVFANGREISCKASDGKSIASFPDVCFTPPDKVPPTPPGVPVPYPNTGMASDTTQGSKHVKLGGKEVMLKNKSYFKKSVGDEAGCATKKGVITSTNRGKVYFVAWSMDVKIEGQNVVRHLDMTTHNHASPTANAASPWPHVARMNLADFPAKPCKRSCPRKPSDERYDQLRKKTPSRSVKKRLNRDRGQKNCAACGGPASPMSWDHIVPLKIMSQMPGFACMSYADQKKLANADWNLVGLCVSCNGSKSDNLWHRWSENKAKGRQWTAKQRKHGMQQTSDRIVNLKAAIRQAPCE